MLLPRSSACTSAVRKWRPAQMRASMSSASACEKLENLRVRGSSRPRRADRLVIWKPSGMASPKNIPRTRRYEPSWQRCPDGCSGYGAVISAFHVGSGSVSALPSSAARVIAFHGRPEVPVVLVVPAVDACVRGAQVLHRKQTGGVEVVKAVSSHEVAGDRVPAHDGSALPPASDVRLLGGAGRAVHRPKRLDLVELRS